MGGELWAWVGGAVLRFCVNGNVKNAKKTKTGNRPTPVWFWRATNKCKKMCAKCDTPALGPGEPP